VSNTSFVACRKTCTLFALAGVSLLFFTLSASALRADEKLSKVEQKPIYPLKQGLTWEYRRILRGESRPNYVKKVIDVVSFAGAVCYLVQEDEINKSPIPYTRWVSVTEDGLYEVGSSLGALGKKPLSIYQPAHRIYRNTNETVTWEDNSKNTFPPGLEKFTGLQYPEKVKIAGVEYDAICVTITAENWKTRNWYAPGIGCIKSQEWDEKGDLSSELELVSFSGRNAVAIRDIVVNLNVIEKEASTESVEAPPGVVTEFKKSRTIFREVSYSTKLGLGAEIEATLEGNLLALRGELTTNIRGAIEKERGEKLGDTETREQTVKIDGNVIQKAKVSWIDTYKTGTVEVMQDGKPYKVPFEFPIGTKLVIKNL
jgi:hypothetical protein